MWLIVALIGLAAAALQAQPEAVPGGTDTTAEIPAAVEEAVVVEEGVVEEGVAEEPGAAPQRDPFRPFTLDLRPDVDASEILTPLQRYELRQLKVVGVLSDLDPPRAMLEDNSGMGYIVSPGTAIGRRGGVVTAIEPRQVIVEEPMLDFYGREQVNRVVLAMPEEDQSEGADQE